ncbi:hypothetical protein GO009_17460 [Muricauda sp. TY007]|uniref:hypothetical protein n=1 Tax=Allomuricauda sp. TY007 TaxID=2683200 RepID=UPI0013BF3C90|nr:hypothetical protein [Muricauda sp. TY007]NDV17798.1 hypothetical protein [Muricauda sp. TY007]
MKNLLTILIALFSIMMIASCSTYRGTANRGTVKRSTAPGQVKKMTGAKNAKAYAPGQQKKKGNNE